MSFPRLRLGFTEYRRRLLATKVDRLDRLESRTTITEPISFTGLALSAIRGMMQLGFMYPNAVSNAPSPFVRPRTWPSRPARSRTSYPRTCSSRSMQLLWAITPPRARPGRSRARLRTLIMPAASPRTTGYP